MMLLHSRRRGNLGPTSRLYMEIRHSLTTAAKKSPSMDTNEKDHVAVTFDLNVDGKAYPVAMIVVGVAEQ
jgi:hypothetical protein